MNFVPGRLNQLFGPAPKAHPNSPSRIPCEPVTGHLVVGVAAYPLLPCRMTHVTNPGWLRLTFTRNSLIWLADQVWTPPHRIVALHCCGAVISRSQSIWLLGMLAPAELRFCSRLPRLLCVTVLILSDGTRCRRMLCRHASHCGHTRQIATSPRLSPDTRVCSAPAARVRTGAWWQYRGPAASARSPSGFTPECHRRTSLSSPPV